MTVKVGATHFRSAENRPWGAEILKVRRNRSLLSLRPTFSAVQPRGPLSRRYSQRRGRYKQFDICHSFREIRRFGK